MKTLLDYVAPATGARRTARKEAAKFALTVRPGHTYYSIVTCRGRYPGSPERLLLEWVFSKPGRWIGQDARCGHMTAAGAWLGYGPLHETRPHGLLTPAEFSKRPDIFEAEAAMRRGDFVPAGV